MDSENQILSEIMGLRKALNDLGDKVSNLERLMSESREGSKFKPYQQSNQRLIQKGEGIAESYPGAPERLNEPRPDPVDGKEDWSILAGQDIVEVAARGRKVEKLLAELVAVYSSFPEVEAIAVGPYLDEIRVFVMLRMEGYDHLLISALIQREHGLYQMFPSLCLSMSYADVRKTDITQSRYDVGTIFWRRNTANSE